MTILYLCDGEGCSNPCHGKSAFCKHTSNIRHAINFKNIADAGAEIKNDAVYVENSGLNAGIITVNEAREKLGLTPETGAQREE